MGFAGRCLRVFSFLLASVFCGSIYTGAVSAAGAGTSQIIVNDNETGTDNFKFNFIGGWVYDVGYPDRFYGGDEYWITSTQFGNNYPSVEFGFVGTQVELYGHKVPAGAMATITIDGNDMGKIDLYNPSRIEKVCIYKSGVLDYAEHKLVMKLIPEQNASSTGTHEASIDYAIVCTAETIPVTSISPDKKDVTLEPDMTYPVTYKLLPGYATEKPRIKFSSSDNTVATVDGNGVITAKKQGSAVITIMTDDGNRTAKMKVNVRGASEGSFTVVAGSTDQHTYNSNYYTLFEGLDVTQDNGLTAVAYRGDTVNAKLDIFSKGQKVSNHTLSHDDFIASDTTIDKLNADFTSSFLKEMVAHDTSNDVPDVIYSGAPVDMEPCTLRSAWISIKIPVDALPGFYTGNITVAADDGTLAVIPYEIEVLALTLPENTAAFELWQYPYSSNRYYSGKTTEEYFGNGIEGLIATHLDDKYMDALRSQVKLFASAGGKTVTVTVVEDPWNSQTPDPYPSMIKWTRETDGSFSFVYTDFDKWVKLNEECGVDGRILSFSISDWANNVT